VDTRLGDLVLAKDVHGPTLPEPAPVRVRVAGRIQTIKTPGGHHRIPVSALQDFLPNGTAQAGSARISGRNQLAGAIIEVTVDGLLAKVVLAIGEQRITAIITSDAVRELALKPGEAAIALIKATEVMIGKS